MSWLFHLREHPDRRLVPGHVLAFDRSGWSIMMGMKEEVPSVRHGVGMSTALFDVISLIEVHLST